MEQRGIEHGREQRRLRAILRQHYYPRVQRTIAVALLLRAVRFETLRWEETTIADLLCDRADARHPLVAIGGDERAGWRRVGRELGRRARARVLSAHPGLGP